MMARAVRCPVCVGKGTIIVYSDTTAGNYEKPCHGCHGSGWVEVSDR